jgi:predicted acetyltransferase
MPLEIRPITDDEVDQAEAMTAYAFNNRERYDLTAAVERSRRFFSVDWSLASFEDGEMTAFIRTVPFAQRINGRGLSFGAVGPVVSAPHHRRKGHVGAILRRALEVMRERGQVLSGLHTPHPTLYQRYGWEIASETRVYSFAPKDIQLKSQPSERGRMRQITPDDWQQLDRVYRAHSKMRSGALHRPEVWWREGVLLNGQPNKADAAIWEDGNGDVQGYVLILQPTQPEGWMPEFLVRELTALTPDAYLNLLSYVLRHDLPEKIVWRAPADDPLHSVVDDARKLRIGIEYDMLLRIVDVEMALKQRPPGGPDANLSLTMRIEDRAAPWNEGVWRLECSEGAVDVQKADGDADIALTSTTLAPLFNGFLSASQLALTGRLQARDETALASADALFSTTYPPFCTDNY